MLQQLDIVIFEPSPHPGAGTVYAPDQPHHLRMNFATQHIDAWIDDRHRTPDQLNLTDWLANHYPESAAPEGYASRAIVGEYLHDCFRQVLKTITRFANVSHVREKVADIERVGDTWRIQSASGVLDVHEVVLTVGHEGWRVGESSDERRLGSRQRYVKSVFPVRRQLSPERVPTGCTVAVRGFGLTWIDAALSLTEDRGGWFEPTASGFVYRANGDEPRVIYPFSRTGRPMLAKPIHSLIKLPQSLGSIWEEGRNLLENTLRPVGKAEFYELIWRPILTTAQRALDETQTKASVKNWWNDWRSSRFTSSQTLDAMRQSIAVARGEIHPTPAWALAEAWRNLYSTIVTLVSHGGLNEDAWGDFRFIAAEMERIAYGPPAENLARIVALIDAGIVDLRHIADTDETLLKQNDIDVVVNAVLPAPTNPAPDGPMSKLLERGQISRLNRFTGIDINSAGRPRSRTGLTQENIAIFGRTTEGCVLGNDTLSRRLHSHIENWSTEVVATMNSDS